MSSDQVPYDPHPGMARVREALDRTTIATSLADARLEDSPLILVNKAFLTLTGYDAHEVMGRNCRFLQGNLPNDAARAEARACLAAGTSAQILFRNRRKSGEVFDNLVLMQSIKDRHGVVEYFIASQFEMEQTAAETPDLAVTIGRNLNDAVALAAASQRELRTEQRRMLANATHAVVKVWLTAG